MSMRKTLIGGGEYELMGSTNDSEHDINTSHDRPVPLGQPIVGRSLSYIDYLVTLLSVLCCAVTMAVIFEARLAAMLGQVNQLIVLGFLLQIMAICTQKQIKYFLLLMECLWHKTTLQNLESITRMDFTGHNVTILNRLAILACLTFPLGLGVAYKTFTGGDTTLLPIFEMGMYGITGPPGTVGITTLGRTLFQNVTMPWWTEPDRDGPFAFNMNVEGPNRTAMLDGPTEDYVNKLRRSLRDDQTIILATTVNATVADMVINIANPNITYDLSWWYSNKTANSTTPRQATDNFWGPNSALYSDGANTIGFGLLVPWGEMNSNFMMTSRFNRTKGQSFGSEAQGFALYRQQYKAEWSITSTSVSLKSATKIGNGPLKDAVSVGLFVNNWLKIAPIYRDTLAEYDWKYIGNTGYFVSNGTDVQYTKQQKYIKTDTTLVAAMVWSRIAAWNGLANPVYKDQVRDGTAWKGTMYPSDSTYQIETKTLKQRPLLAVVLAINPAVMLIILAVRLTLLKGAPIWVNFGITSLLAAIDPKSKLFLRGAGYSGELKQDVVVKFSIANPDHAHDGYGYERLRNDHGEHIVVTLERMDASHPEEPVRKARVVHGVIYE